MWCSSRRRPQALWPKACFMILLHYNGVLMNWVWMFNPNLIGHAPVAIHWAQASPTLFCCPALWIQGSPSAWKAPEFWYGSLWSCSTQGFIIHNLLKSLLQQLPKIPLVRNAIMRRSGCFVTHCFIKKIFFFKQIFSRRIQRFSKATANTEQLIILFLKGLPLHRRFLYLKILEMLRFSILLCCTWPLGWGKR